MSPMLKQSASTPAQAFAIALVMVIALAAFAAIGRAETPLSVVSDGPAGDTLSQTAVTSEPAVASRQQRLDPINAQPLDARLAKAGLVRGAEVLIRIFKEESELELWLKAGDRFKRFATYPICKWRGVLGPKLVEGDRQSPEGFYSFGQNRLIWQGHWFRAFHLNFPNAFDQALGRYGSGILIHGACSSIGCYAMSDPIIDEMFDLIVAAFAAGQPRVQVHVFPFHMTLANLARHEKSPWLSFWRDLKPASDLFVATQIPPRIGICDGRYVVRRGSPGEASKSLVDWCGSVPWGGSADRATQVLAARHELAQPAEAAATDSVTPTARVRLYARLSREGMIPKPQPLPAKPTSYGPSPEVSGRDPAEPFADTLLNLPEAERAALLGVRKPWSTTVQGGNGAAAGSDPAVPGPGYRCNPSLAACRHFIANNRPASTATKTAGIRAAKTKLAKR